MKIRVLVALLAPLAASQAGAPALQIRSLSVSTSVSTTATQAILQYSSPLDQACSLKVADMNRRIAVTTAVSAGGVVSITTRAPHGLAAGTQVYIEGTEVEGWNRWQTVSAVADPGHFSFPSPVEGAATAGNIGVLIDDVNPRLFPGADQDSRSGNPNSGRRRVFVVGKRTAETAADGNRYTRALQVNSRHNYSLTCGTEDFNGEFATKNLPLGDTHNEGPPVDRTRPGEYAYPTVQWTNRAQSLIDPLTGVRSVRMTSPVGTASTARSFLTAIAGEGTWTNPSGPLSAGGKTMFTGPCNSGNCPLLLRADDLSIYGGATYTTGYGTGSSLDWVAVTITGASVSDGACVGDDCKIVACLTVNGVACNSAQREISLTGAAASYTIGSKAVMDLWQDSGAPGIARPDVSKGTGTVDYTDAGRRVSWKSGDKFSGKWTPGSRIMVAGSEYAIESIQSEISLTLAAPGPVGALSAVPYSANNFGVLLWKKSPKSDTVTIGPTTYQYGASPPLAWPAGSTNSCGPVVLDVNGLPGYNCFMDRELYWISKDGSDMRDLGFVGLTYSPGGPWSASWTCGSSSYNGFDPSDGNTWYCLLNVYSTWVSVVKATYKGNHTTTASPGVTIPDCKLNGSVHPCVEFTIMQPTQSTGMAVEGPLFNPDYAVSGYRPVYWGFWGGITASGELMLYARGGAQDTIGWMFVYTLGDRTPIGTGPNSMRMIASASSYRKAPWSWCTIHGAGVAEDGYAYLSSNDMSIQAGQAYYLTLDGMTLTASVGGTGGIKACPSNPFGVSGTSCTDVTVTGEPVKYADGSYLQDIQVGDMLYMNSEYMRVVTKTDHTHFTVQRGYRGTIAVHAGPTIGITCGLKCELQESMSGIWDFRADPYGANVSWNTVLADKNEAGGHSAAGPNVRVSSVGYAYRIGEAGCPRSVLGPFGVCYQVRRGTTLEALQTLGFGVAIAPPFAGVMGFGLPNVVDSHPGPCSGTWCLDARPMNGGGGDGNVFTLGTVGAPWVNNSGQLWKFANGAATLQRKKLTTMAYVGRKALVDVSGASSLLGTSSSDSYRYCVAIKAGECRPDSAVGDVYVNAPLVSKPYCNYPGIAVQSDDTHSICVGPLGAYTGNLAQFGTVKQDTWGERSRRLGTLFSRWNQQSVFWNMTMDSGGNLGLSQVRWLDGVRNEDLLTVLPSYPATDSVSRNGFVPIRVTIPPGKANGGVSIVVEFGYGDYGAPGSFFCTTRQESCIATRNAVDQDTPFYFATSETYQGAPCDLGCTVTVPALSQRVLYYRWKQLDSSGKVVSISDTRTLATP